jgi:hypothetical protein
VADRASRLNIRQPAFDHRREGEFLDDLFERTVVRLLVDHPPELILGRGRGTHPLIVAPETNRAKWLVGTVYDHGETFELVFAQSVGDIRLRETLDAQAIERLRGFARGLRLGRKRQKFSIRSKSWVQVQNRYSDV